MARTGAAAKLLNALGNIINPSTEEKQDEVIENQTDGSHKTQIIHEDQTPGALITGIDYVSGKSGIDASTESLNFINYEHHEIHSGSHFFVGDYTTLANGATYDILFVTPNTLKYSHMIFEIATKAEATFAYYEDVTTSNDGTTIAMFNRNRVIATAPGTNFYHTPTVTNVGTLIGRGIFGSGKQAGGSIRDSNEFVLKPNKKYLLRVTNNTVSDNWYDWFFDWYEHTDKN